MYRGPRFGDARRMQAEEMDRLIATHVGALVRGDSGAAVARHAEDAEHDLAGATHGPVRGRSAVRRFYDHLVLDVRTESMVPVRRYHGEDFCVVEHEWSGRLQGSLLGTERSTLRILQIFEFTDGKISRESVWMDDPSIARRLTD